MTNSESILILLIEDDPGHARLVEKNLRRSNIQNKIIVFKDGQEAVNFFFVDQAHLRLQTPLLVVLDLNIPVLDGYQLLKRLKHDPQTKHIPVFILTTEDDAREIKRCYDGGCNVCITKPVDYAQFSDAICKLGLFLSIVSMPESRLTTYG
jgi:CheY-like chemotaxis protein